MVQLLKQLELECMILYMKKLVGHILKYVKQVQDKNPQLIVGFIKKYCSNLLFLFTMVCTSPLSSIIRMFKSSLVFIVLNSYNTI
jgi:hypothetical protein